MSEPANIKIVLPNKPHSSALQVEEIGSYSYATHEESVCYKSTDSGDKLSQGIIDELFSDDDITMSRKHCASRGISIMSASEDEGSLQGEMLSREISIDERAIDDGLTKIRMSRTVLEETEVSFVEVDENGLEKPILQSLGGDKKKQKGKFFIAEAVEEESVPDSAKPDVETVTLKPRKGKMLVKEEVDDESTGFDFNEKTSKNKDLTEENLNLKQKGKEFEIKKAEEEAKLQMKIQEEDNSDFTPKKGKLLEVSEKIEKSEEISESTHIEKKKLDEGRKKSIKVEEEDDDIDRLIKRIQKQRNALDDILENKQTTKDDENSKKQKAELGEKQKKTTEVFDEKAKSILEDENSYKNKKHQSVLDDSDEDETDDESDKEEGRF